MPEVRTRGEASGGWAGGDRSQHNDIIAEFAKRGYVAATIGYRLVPTARFPAQVNDVKCAVRFLRANAEKYGIDPDKPNPTDV